MNYDLPSEKDNKSLRIYGLALFIPQLLIYIPAMIYSGATEEMVTRLYIEAYTHFIVAAYMVVYFIFVGIKFVPYNITAYKSERWPPPNSRVMYKYLVRTGNRAKVYAVFCCLALVLFLLVLAVPPIQKGRHLLFGANEIQRLGRGI